MTIMNETSEVVYEGNGAATEFSFSFLIPTGGLTVSLSDGVSETVLSAGEYSVTGLDDSDGGKVTYSPAGGPLTSGNFIIIQRALAYTQPITLENQQRFFPAVVGGGFDRATMQIQQLAAESDRFVRIARGSSLTPDTAFSDLINARTDAQASAELAADWAEGPDDDTNLTPDGAGTKSSKGWAELAKELAQNPEDTQAELTFTVPDGGGSTSQAYGFSALHYAAKSAASATEAALYDGPWYDDVPSLIASTDEYADGTIIRTREEGFAYRMDSTATVGFIENSATTAQKFVVLPGPRGLDARAFNVKGDNSTDDTTALIAFAAAVIDQQIDAYLPAEMTCLCSSALSFPGTVNLWLYGRITYTGTDEISFLTVTANNPFTSLYYELNVNRQTLASWLDDNNIGVELNNIQFANASIRYSARFTNGVKLTGNSSSSYNHITLSRMQDNRRAFWIEPETGGFSNQNTVFLKEAAVSSSVRSSRPSISPEGVKIVAANQNVFFNPSVEIGKTGSSVAFRIQKGRANHIYSIRSEAHDVTCICESFIDGGQERTFDNFVVAAYNTDFVFQDQTNGLNIGKEGFDDNSTEWTWWRSGLLGPKIVLNDAGGAYLNGIGYVSFSTSLDLARTAFGDRVLRRGGALGVNSFAGVGVTLNTNGIKKFQLKKKAPATGNNTTIVGFRVKDASGTILDESTDGIQVFIANTKIPFNGSINGGAFTEPAATSTGQYLIRFKETGVKTIASVDVLVRGVNSVTWSEIEEISLGVEGNKTPDVSVGVWENSIVSPNGPRVIVSDNLPVAGYYEQPTIIYKAAHSASGKIGWTLVSGNYATKGAWTNSTAYTIGEWVSDAGGVHECISAGTSSGTGTADDTGCDWLEITASGTPASWKEWGDIAA